MNLSWWFDFFCSDEFEKIFLMFFLYQWMMFFYFLTFNIRPKSLQAKLLAVDLLFNVWFLAYAEAFLPTYFLRSETILWLQRASTISHFVALNIANAFSPIYVFSYEKKYYWLEQYIVYCFVGAAWVVPIFQIPLYIWWFSYFIRAAWLKKEIF